MKAVGKLLPHCLEKRRITIIIVVHIILLKDLDTLALLKVKTVYCKGNKGGEKSVHFILLVIRVCGEGERV